MDTVVEKGIVPALVVLAALCAACDDHRGDSDAGDGSPDADADADTDADTDSDSDGGPDAGGDWCPALPTSCAAPTALESCGDDSLGAPRLIAPLSGRYIRDRRPEIIWDGAPEDAGVSQYRVEIARDRDFTDVVYRSTSYEAYPGNENRFHHIVSCDLDCGVHFFRVLSVSSPECEVGTPTYTWEISVGMAPYDLDRDGVPDIMCWHVEPSDDEFGNDLIQGYAIFDLDERGGTTLTQDDLEKVVEFEVEHSTAGWWARPGGQGDVDGDNTFDIGIELSNSDENVSEYYVFSGLKRGQVQGLDAARFSLTTLNGAPDIKPYLSTYTGYFFNDINGDGLSDIVFRNVAILGILVLLGSEAGLSGDVTSVDFRYTVPSDYWVSLKFIFDINGDGLPDLVGPAEYDGGSDYDEVFAHLSEDTAPSEMDLFDNAATVTCPTEDPVIGDYTLSSAFNDVELIGDADFNGYPELLMEVEAYNPALSTEISTGGIVALSELLDAEEHTYSDIMKFAIVGDFPIDTDQQSTEQLVDAVPCGDVNGDGIDDVCVRSHKLYSGDDIGSNYRFNGRVSWDSLILASASEYQDDKVVFIADIDGDGLPESTDFSLVGAVESTSIFLSSGGEITTPTSLFGVYCEYSQGWLLPTSLM